MNTNEIHKVTKETTKETKALIWCKHCFDKLWETAHKEGWGGDDIEKRLETNIRTIGGDPYLFGG